jgi:cell division septum initiation protein DivIVA
LCDYARELEQARDNLRQQLAEHNISLHDYIERVVNIEQMIEAVNQTADRFDDQADNLRSQDIIKIASAECFRRSKEYCLG